MIGDGLKAVDGAFWLANASKNQLIMKKTLTKDLKTIEENIDNYLNNLDSVDKEKQPIDLAGNLPQDIEKLKAQREILLNDLKYLETIDKNQHNRTDKDANLMIKPFQNLVAYNSQNVVDDKYHLIVATDVSTKGNDADQIYKMAMQTKENLELSKDDKLDIVADTGYHSAKEFTDRFNNKTKKPTGNHIFDTTCAKNNIEHRLTAPYTPKTNGMVERVNGKVTANILDKITFKDINHMKGAIFDRAKQPFLLEFFKFS